MTASARVEPGDRGALEAELTALWVVRDEEIHARLGRAASVEVRLILATQEAPLAPRGALAYARISALVAPGLAAETRARAFALSSLARAARDRSARAWLERRARVLNDGRVQAAVIRSVVAGVQPVDIADLTQGGRAWKWESRLVTRDGVPADEAPLLGAYQSLLAADYLAGNLARRHALVLPSGRGLTVWEQNEVFTEQPREGAISDGLVRLSRFMTYSKRLQAALEAVERVRLIEQLTEGGALLVTPKQTDEILARRQALLKLIETRVAQRGRERALALP